QRGLLGFLVLLIAVLGLAAVGCGGDDGGGGGKATALPSASCGPIRYEGDGDPEALIASDFPLQGANRSLTTEMADAVEFALKQRDWKVGDTTIGFQSCDDSTAQARGWEFAERCSKALAHAR